MSLHDVPPISRSGHREADFENRNAGVLELADEVDSKSIASDGVRVQVPPPAPNQHNPNPRPVGPYPVGDGFGFVFWFEPYEARYFRNGVRKRPESKPRGPKKKMKNCYR